MNHVLISVDAGKKSIKVKSNDMAFKCDNLVLQSDDAKKPANNNSFEVIYDGKRYLVGDKVKALKDYSSNKINEHNKIAIYTAIAEILDTLEVNNVSIRLVVGLPNLHYNMANENSFKALLSGDNIKITLNGSDKVFSIDDADILIMPENYSVDFDETPMALLLDFGFRNININLLEYGNMLPEFMRHSELGIIECKKLIAKNLEYAYNEHYTDTDITDYLVKNGLPNNKESLNIIISSIKEYLREVKNDLEREGIKLKLVNTIAIRGGGSQLINLDLFKDIFEKHGSSVVIDGGEYRNVYIYELVGKQYFA